MYRVNSSSAYHELQHQHQQQQQQQQQRPKLAAWRSLNALSEHLGTQELCRLPQSLPVQYSTDMAMSTDADLDPLDPAFLASINDPCSSRKVQVPPISLPATLPHALLKLFCTSHISKFTPDIACIRQVTSESYICVSYHSLC